MFVRARTGLLALAVVAVVTAVAFAPRGDDGTRVLGDARGAHEAVSHALLGTPIDATNLPEVTRSKGKRSSDIPGPLFAFTLAVVLTAFMSTSYRQCALSRSSVRTRASARFAASRRAPPRFV
jgi:hypothetical protein